MLGGIKLAEAYLLPPKFLKRKKKKPLVRPVAAAPVDDVARMPTKSEHRLKIAADIINQHNQTIERFLSGVGR